ncbi:MAG TPA: hypothetical protein VGN81_13715, partial [Pseudonocardiaceae bacterium]
LRRDLGEHWQVERMEVRKYATGLSAEQTRMLLAAVPADAPVDVSWLDSVGADGHVQLPVWQVTATC